MIAEPTGTEGHRPIDRPWHASRLKNFALGEVILLLYLEHAATSSSQDDPFTSPLDDPRLLSLPGHPQAVHDPRWKIPPSQWEPCESRVEQGGLLRHLARDYGVSYEVVRRVLHAAAQWNM